MGSEALGRDQIGQLALHTYLCGRKDVTSHACYTNRLSPSPFRLFPRISHHSEGEDEA